MLFEGRYRRWEARSFSGLQSFPERVDTIASDRSTGTLVAAIPVTKDIKDELDSGGDTQLLEDSVDVVPDRMFFYLELLSDFAVLQAVGDKPDHILFATRQQRQSFMIVNMKWFNMRQGVQQMFDIFVTHPDLSLVYCLDALR